MSEPTALELQLTKIFDQRLNLVVPSAQTDLFEAGGLDSLSFVELLVQIEGEFGIHVSFEDLELDNFRSIAKIANFIAKRHDAKVSDIAERATAQRRTESRSSREHI